MGLSIDGINLLCRLAGSECLDSISSVQINDLLMSYSDKVKSEEDSTKKKKYRDIQTFLRKVSKTPREELVNLGELRIELVKDYRGLKTKSWVSDVQALFEIYGTVFSVEDIESVIQEYRRHNRILTRAIGLFVALAMVLAVMLCLSIFQRVDQVSYEELQQFVTVAEPEKTTNVVYVATSGNEITELAEDSEETDEEEEEEEQAEEEQAEPEVEDVKFSADFDQLTKINGDIRAYLYFVDEDIAYPVMGCMDNEKYLRADYTGAYSYAGSLFIDYRNSFSLDDPFTIIYGHNMKNGSMFGILKKYRDSEYASSHSRIQIDTPDGLHMYSVIAAFTVDTNSDFYSIKSMGLMDRVSQIIASKNEISSDYVYERGDRLVALSTCTGLGYGSRFVVILKEI